MRSSPGSPARPVQICAGRGFGGRLVSATSVDLRARAERGQMAFRIPFCQPSNLCWLEKGELHLYHRCTVVIDDHCPPSRVFATVSRGHVHRFVGCAVDDSNRDTSIYGLSRTACTIPKRTEEEANLFEKSVPTVPFFAGGPVNFICSTDGREIDLALLVTGISNVVNKVRDRSVGAVKLASDPCWIRLVRLPDDVEHFRE